MRYNVLVKNKYAGVAQPVEQLICNRLGIAYYCNKYERLTDMVERFLHILKSRKAALLQCLSIINLNLSIMENSQKVVAYRLPVGCQYTG